MKVNDIIIKEGEVIAFRLREPYKRVPEKVRELAARWFWANEDYDQTGSDSKVSLERLLRSRGYTIAFDDSKENIVIVHQNGSQYKFPVVDAYNYTGWHRDLFMESRYKFAGELVGQKPGDQVRGHEIAKPSKKQHPFKGRLVGTAESLENISEVTGDPKFDAMLAKITDPKQAGANISLGRALQGQQELGKSDANEESFFNYGDQILAHLKEIANRLVNAEKIYQNDPRLLKKYVDIREKYMNTMSVDNRDPVWAWMLKILGTTHRALWELEQVLMESQSLTLFIYEFMDGDFDRTYLKAWNDYKESFKKLNEASTTLQRSRDTSQTMKTARNIDYSPALQKNVEAVILAAHQKLQLPHDLNWMNLPPLDGLVGMNIFTDENLRKIWAYHRDPNQYTGTMADKNKLAALAFLIKGPAGAVVMVATPDYKMRIPRKFEMSAAYIDLGDGTLNTVRDVTKTKILPVIKAATGKVNVRSGEILVADIRQKHTGKISQRQQRSQEVKKDTESTTVAYRKIYRLIPGILQQVEADIMGMVQSLIKNKSYERAKQKIERLDLIKNLENNITADSTNYFLMRANDLALYMTASHLFPDQTGEITKSYGGYGVEDTKGVERVVALIANNDRPTLSMFLAFFKRTLLLI